MTAIGEFRAVRGLHLKRQRAARSFLGKEGHKLGAERLCNGE